MKNIKLRLTVMNFLQYAVWGSWLISLGTYLGKNLLPYTLIIKMHSFISVGDSFKNCSL